MSIHPAPDSADHASIAGCEARLHTVFSPGTIAWVTDEQYEQNGPTLRVTLVFQSDQGLWRRRRYRYDIPSDTLHYGGETPVTDGELAAARANGRRL
jgi:hypothetical protein